MFKRDYQTLGQNFIINNIELLKGRKSKRKCLMSKQLSKRKCFMKAFVTSQFIYCPLIWMFYSRELNNRINRIHEPALRLVYQDNSLSFAELLKKDNSVTIHQKNLQVLERKFLN